MVQCIGQGEHVVNHLLISFEIYFSGSLPHRHKIIIAGNHDIPFDTEMVNDPEMKNSLHYRFGLDINKIQDYFTSNNLRDMKEMLTDCTYLEDSGITVFGINIWGSPWYVAFHYFNNILPMDFTFIYLKSVCKYLYSRITIYGEHASRGFTFTKYSNTLYIFSLEMSLSNHGCQNS